MSLFQWALWAGGIFTFAWLISGTVVAVVASRRGGGPVPWILWGLLLGPIGLYVILKLMDHECPSCQSPVLRAVRHCPACAAEIPRLENNPVGPMWTYRRGW
jgi:endogenous inhibitor of DNA gyrase (YacG/DUF329 family)